MNKLEELLNNEKINEVIRQLDKKEEEKKNHFLNLLQ